MSQEIEALLTEIGFEASPEKQASAIEKIASFTERKVAEAGALMIDEGPDGHVFTNQDVLDLRDEYERAIAKIDTTLRGIDTKEEATKNAVQSILDSDVVMRAWIRARAGTARNPPTREALRALATQAVEALRGAGSPEALSFKKRLEELG